MAPPTESGCQGLQMARTSYKCLARRFRLAASELPLTALVSGRRPPARCGSSAEKMHGGDSLDGRCVDIRATLYTQKPISAREIPRQNNDC